MIPQYRPEGNDKKHAFPGKDYSDFVYTHLNNISSQLIGVDYDYAFL